jgi:hypothetical protein
MATTTKSWRDVLTIHPAADMFPLLGPEELKALGEDIRANGLMMPIDLFATELGGPYLVLDGRNRLDAMESIGWRFEYDGRHIAAIDQTGEEMRGAWGIPNSKSLTAEAYGWDPIPFDPYDYVISVNIRRRHLTTAQKGELIAALLRANPERSDRAIAKDVKVDHKTVSARREKLEQGGEIPHHDVRTGSDGVAQPATKPLQKPADTEPPEPQRPAVEEPAGTEQDQAGEPAVVPPSLGPEMDPASLDHELKDWVATFNSWSIDLQKLGLTLLDVEEEEDRELLALVEIRGELIVKLREDIARLGKSFADGAAHCPR